jgi:hypothetical protein
MGRILKVFPRRASKKRLVDGGNSDENHVLGLGISQEKSQKIRL